ncbi:WG repeat-containing protein [Crocosphaera sp. Alani8]|uniref:WG repeat-containing protein n=1 Tax=Crocosphaera sp. Alani8 TaxID=3038952 RepID=UPI00313F1A18
MVAHSNYLFPIIQNQKTGYIDSEGKTIIEPCFDLAGNFSEGLAPVKNSGCWNYIDFKGQYVFKSLPNLKFVCDFSEGLAAVNENNLWGYINQLGEII